MAQFKDSENREWFIRVHTTIVERIKEKLGVNPLDLLNGELQKKTAADHMLLFKLIWAFCEQQAEKSAITQEQFSEAMLGDQFSGAMDALYEAVADFVQIPEARVNLREIRRLSKIADTKTQEIAAKRVKAIDIDALVNEAIAKADRQANEKRQAEMNYSPSATDSQESAVSVQTA